ncbi:unnamed protein product [Darwinula stevensoni]|uniref:Uncharacterized protein n=1 Tax=Darwinula stevensoni TaxID=69355 RepID=A0A7R9FRT3_9CRUS|nr:unnamed protein product [Darwinula stevensoni]CAG0902342.1 unnamed protein product [Darwinula stevensoni]
MRRQELAWIPPPIVKIAHPVKCIVCNEAVGCRPFQNSLLILPGLLYLSELMKLWKRRTSFLDFSSFPNVAEKCRRGCKRISPQETPLINPPGIIFQNHSGQGDSTDCASETREESASLAESTESSTLVESDAPSAPSQPEGEAEDVNSVSLTVSRTHQFAIKSNWEELLELMDVERVENHMISKDKLPLHKWEELNMEKVKKKRRSVLLHYVHSTDEDVFLAFQDWLVAAGQAYLAEKLHP